MLVSLPFRRFVQQLARVVTRRALVRVRLPRRDWQFVAAAVETLETRELLSSIIVNSTSGGQDYASTVTVSQLNPAQTAVTLRDAINAVNNTKGIQTISFDSSVFPPNAATPTTITLTGGTPLELSDNTGTVTITGPGASALSVSGANQSTVFVVDFGVTAVLQGMTVTGGKASVSAGLGNVEAGGIYNNGHLTLQNLVVTGNAGGEFGGGFFNNNTATVTSSTFSNNAAQFGGGLFNAGTITVTGSTFSGNSATSNGGGFYNQAFFTLESSTVSSNSATNSGGGFYNNNNVALVDSTVALNSAGASGGGFYDLLTVNATDSTIADNYSALGAGVYNAFATVNLSGTIVAQNVVSPTNSASRDWGGSGAGVLSSYDIIGDGTNSGFVNGMGHNIVGTTASPVNPLLAPLGNYGGPTQTLALLPGSLAINAGSNFNDPLTGTTIATDQRGVSRSQGSAPDIGAYESAGFALVVTGGNNQSAIVGDSFAQPLAVQLTEKAFGKALPDAGLVVTFTPPASGASVKLSAGSATTSANGAASVTAQANATVGGPYSVVASAAGIDSTSFQLSNIEAPGLVVNTTQDVVNSMDGVTSLREAIAYADTLSTPTTITFAPSVFPPGALTTITLTGGSLELSNKAAQVTIAGPGAGRVAISGAGASTVFVVDAGVSAAIDGLTITGGKGTSGGGIQNAGTLALQNDALTGNSATSGGGVFNSGSLALTASTVSGNSATAAGGGLYNSGSATLVQSTLSGNSAPTGGAIDASAGTVTVTASTIAANFAASGGGIFNGSSDVKLAGSILALNTVSATSSTPSDWAGSAADAASSFNLIGDATNTGLVAGVNANIAGNAADPVNPQLGPLANNGGPTQTMALLATSPAINAGSNTLVSGLATDQRGSGFSRIAGGTADIGAYEIQSHPPATPTVGALSTTNTTPALSGIWDPANAVVLAVTISNSGYSATYTLGANSQLTASGGNWSLNLAGTTPLAVASYNVVVHTVNDIGEVANSATGLLTIQSTPPVIAAPGPQTARIGAPVGISVAVLSGDVTGLTATINWGDGTTTNATLATISGVLTVSGSHAYAAEGQFTIQVTATNASSLSGSSFAVATILTPVPAAPTVNNLTTTSQTPTLSGTFDSLYATVLGVTISNGAAYSATYTLGTDSQLTVNGAAWSLNLTGTTPLAIGSYTVSVHTANDHGESSDSAPGSLTVNSTPPVIATLSPQSARIGVPVNVSAAITGGDTTGLVATINWGDGTQTAATLATISGVLTVSGSHAYAVEGQYTIQVTATNASNLSGSVSALATILPLVPAAPTANPLSTTNPTPILTGTFDPVYASVLEVTISNSATAYSASYTLGTSPQLTTTGTAWDLNLGSTTPLAVGSYTVVVHTANDIGESSDSAPATLTILSTPPVVASLNPQTATIGFPVTIAAGITGGDTTGLVATIDWGDGTTTAGTLATVSGVLTVSGSHAYSAEGQYTILVTATNASNLSGSSSAVATILTPVPATPTVTSLSTTNPNPLLSGTYDALYATVLQVTIANGASYSATYTLGTSPQLTASGGTWSLNLAGTTPLAVGSYSLLVHTANDHGEGSDSVPGSLTIQSTPPVIATLSPQTARIGVPVNVSAAITGGDTTGLVASIDWGDGTMTAGTLATVNGVLTVSGSHAYAAEGQFTIALTATNASNLSGSSSALATIVTPVPATPTVTSLTTTNTTPTLSGTWDSTYAVVLQVTVSNSAAGYSATYTLGTDSQLTANGGAWSLNLAGTTPLALGSYTVVVHTANDHTETSDSAPGALTIQSTAPVLGALTPQAANVGAAVNIATAITGGDTTGLAATINWGDGTTTAATLATVNGVLTASGSHAYSSAGQFNIQLTATNAANLSASVSTTASITAVSTGANLTVTGGSSVQITSTNATANADFRVQFVSGGVRLIGQNGTTFNGAQSLFLKNASSLAAQLGNGNNHVVIDGSGKNVALSMGTGQNNVSLRNFTGDKVQVTSTGSLTMHAANSTLTSLSVTGGGSADLFRASGLVVSTETQINLGNGTNSVQIDASRFKNFKLDSSGPGTTVGIETGDPNGTRTVFSGNAIFNLGGGARLNFSPNAKSDPTVFGGNLNINAGSPNAVWRFDNVSFAKRPVLHNVVIR